MYEFKFSSAVHASISDIEKSKKQIVDRLYNTLFASLSKKYSKELIDDLFGLIKELEQNPQSEEINKEFAEKLQGFEKADLEFIDYMNDIIYYINDYLNVILEIDKLKDGSIKIQQVESLIKKSISMGTPLNLYIAGYSTFGNESEHIDMLFTQDLLNLLVAMNDYVVTNGGNPIKFMEDPHNPQNSWDLQQVMSANQEIDQIVQIIKMHNFSPFEAATFIHHYITSSFAYKENEENATQPRSIVGILNTDDIVCVGYAKFTKAIIDKLGMPGLEAFTIESVIKPIVSNTPVKMENQFAISGFAHLQNLISIKDEKYNINGTYVTDACWDCKNDEFPNGKGFGNFMYPVTDYMNYKGVSFNEVDKTNYYDRVKKCLTDVKIQPNVMPVIQNFGKQSSPIPAEKLKNSIYTVYRRIYPMYKRKEIEELTEKIMAQSSQVAASIFSEKAQGSIAKLGYQSNTKSLDTQGIIR